MNKINMFEIYEEDNNSLKIKNNLIDYFRIKNFSSRQKNGLPKIWDLDNSFTIYDDTDKLMKIRAYKGFTDLNNGRMNLLCIFKNGIYRSVECNKHNFYNWLLNLTLSDIESLYKTLKDQSNEIELKNTKILKKKNKIKVV